MGVRLQQSVGGVTTSYTLDLNTGLTQVLADGSNTYLYGRCRIAQVSSSTTQYFLGDALGSVRQVVDPAAESVLTQSYQPYGGVLSQHGGSGTPYGFTGELADQTGLFHLRARYYSPISGRFLTRDVWRGNNQQLMSFNAWLYVFSNPVNLLDPCGLFSTSQSHPEPPFPKQTNPSINPSSGWALGLTKNQWEATYVSQGIGGTHDCRVASLLIMLNATTNTKWVMGDVKIYLRVPDFGSNLNNKIQKSLDCLKIDFNYKSAIGATHPLGIVNQYNRLSNMLNIARKAVHISHGTKDQLLNEINNQNPVTVIKIWKNGGAHYITIIAYDEPSDTIFYMDPKDIEPNVEKVISESWSDFSDDWSRQAPWSESLHMQNEMIVYRYTPRPIPAPHP